MGCSLSSQAGTKRKRMDKGSKQSKKRKRKQAKSKDRVVEGATSPSKDRQVNEVPSDGDDGFSNAITSSGLNSTTSSNSDPPSKRVKASRAPARGASASDTTTANPLLPGSREATVIGSERGDEPTDTTSTIISTKREKRKAGVKTLPSTNKDEQAGPICLPKKRGQMSEAKGKIIRLWLDAGDHGGPGAGGPLLDPQDIHGQVKREQHLEFDRQQHAMGGMSQSLTEQHSIVSATMTGTSAWSNTIGATVGSTYEFGEKATTRVVAQMPGPRPSQPVLAGVGAPENSTSGGQQPITTSQAYHSQHRQSTQISSLNAPGGEELFKLLNSQIGEDLVYVAPSNNDDDQSVKPMLRLAKDGQSVMSGRSGSTAISSTKSDGYHTKEIL